MLNLSTLALRKLRTDVRHESCRSPAQHELHRLHCVYLVALGHSCREVASWFGDGTRSVQRWVTAYAACACEADTCSGAERASLAGPSGRPPRVSPEAAQQVRLDLQGLPCQFGYPQGRWDGRLLQQHLQACFRVEMGLRQCQRFLRDAAQAIGAPA